MLIMENMEEVLQILERFTKLRQKDIPKELEDYLCYVAKTGDTVYRWANIKYLFREKLMHVIKDFHDTTPSIDDLPQYPNVDPFNYETMKSALLERLELFNAAPFTIQRLCELLTDPRKQYSRIDKYMRALEKNILVVSTIEPGRKHPESENGDSLDSVVNGDLSLDVNVDIDMENETIFNMESQNSSSTSSTSSKVDEHGNITKKVKIDVSENSNNKSKKAGSTDASDDNSTQENKDEVKFEGNSADNYEENSNNKEKLSEVEPEKSTSEVKFEKNIETSTEVKADLTNNDNHENSNKESIEKVVDGTFTNNLESNIDENTGKPEEKISLENTDRNTENIQAEDESLCKKETSQESRDNTVKQEVEAVDNVPSTSQLSKPVQHPEITQQKALDEKEKSNECVTSQNVANLTESESLPVEPSLKIPEQMSVEESQSISESQTTVSLDTTSNNPVVESSTADQPMDENLEPPVSFCAVDSSCVDEVVMHSESEMATEPIKPTDDKTDLTGMEVDDTSQEEAMDH